MMEDHAGRKSTCGLEMGNNEFSWSGLIERICSMSNPHLCTWGLHGDLTHMAGHHLTFDCVKSPPQFTSTKPGGEGGGAIHY